MTLRLFKDNAFSTLAAAITTTGQTTAQVQSGDGAAKFPSLTPGHHFMATLTQAGNNETSWEIVKCTALSTDTFTIERGKEGTTAATWAIGDKFELRLTALGIDFVARLMAERQFGIISPTGSNTLTSLGLASGGLTFGTITGYQPVASSTLAAAQKAALFTSTGITNANGAGWSGDNDTWLWRGGSAQHGGFYMRSRFIPQDIVAGNRLFIGVNPSGSVTINGATEPSATGSDMFGLGCDSGDTNVTIFSRSASGTTTKTALSTPVSFVSMVGRMYDLTIECEPGVVSTMKLKLVEWNGDTRSVLHDGTVSATLPAAETLMKPYWGFGQGSDVALARKIRLARLYFEFSSPV